MKQLIQNLKTGLACLEDIPIPIIRKGRILIHVTQLLVSLGLIGFLTAQLLKANGCQVIGADVDEDKLSIANDLGIIAFNDEQGDGVKFVED